MEGASISVENMSAVGVPGDGGLCSITSSSTWMGAIIKGQSKPRAPMFSRFSVNNSSHIFFLCYVMYRPRLPTEVLFRRIMVGKKLGDLGTANSMVH